MVRACAQVQAVMDCRDLMPSVDRHHKDCLQGTESSQLHRASRCCYTREYAADQCGVCVAACRSSSAAAIKPKLFSALALRRTSVRLTC